MQKKIAGSNAKYKNDTGQGCQMQFLLLQTMFRFSCGGKDFGWNPQQPNWPKDWTMLGYLED